MSLTTENLVQTHRTTKVTEDSERMLVYMQSHNLLWNLNHIFPTKTTTQEMVVFPGHSSNLFNAYLVESQ